MKISQIYKGLRTYSKAHQVIVQHRLWPYMIVPGVLSFFYFAGLILLGMNYFPDISNYVYTHWVPGFLQWRIVAILTDLILWAMLFLTGYATFQPIILILFSPFLAYLSEVTENRLYDRQSLPFSINRLLKDIIRTIALNLRLLVKMILLMCVAWLFILVPFIGSVISTILIIFIQSRYNGCCLVDYTLERKRYKVKDRFVFFKQNRSQLTGIGMGFMGLFLIPVLGWITAPTYGTVAATLAALEVIEEESSVFMK